VGSETGFTRSVQYVNEVVNVEPVEMRIEIIEAVGNRLAVPVSINPSKRSNNVVSGVGDQRRVMIRGNVPLFLKKFNKCGICSRSDGTFGLSRVKCTLSN